MRSIIVVLLTPFGVFGGALGLLLFGLAATIGGDGLISITEIAMGIGLVLMLAGIFPWAVGEYRNNEKWARAGSRVTLFGLAVLIGAPLAYTILIIVLTLIFITAFIAFLTGGFGS